MTKRKATKFPIDEFIGALLEIAKAKSKLDLSRQEVRHAGHLLEASCANREERILFLEQVVLASGSLNKRDRKLVIMTMDGLFRDIIAFDYAVTSITPDRVKRI